MRELALFAGAGGGILGGHLLGWQCVCAVEINDYARRVLLARQRDGMLPRFPIWDDITTFDGQPWRGRVDVVSGGFPCQDISAAGKGAGITGERSGLWSHMARVIGEVGPRFVIVENSPMLISRGIEVVLGDLAALGYDAAWGVVGAHHIGAPHKRDRIWIVAYGSGQRHGDSEGEVFPRRNTVEYGRDDRYANGINENEVAEVCRGAHTEPCRICANVADSNRIREPQSQGLVEEQRGRSRDGRQVLANSECSERRSPSASKRGDQGRTNSNGLRKRQEVSGWTGASGEVVAYTNSIGWRCATAGRSQGIESNHSSEGNHLAYASSTGLEGRKQPGTLRNKRGGANTWIS